ncbi:Gas vesicle synthesis protein GvpO [Actinopolymorpha cephalotaxi]|nr:Gas vesicle synthesis protein GvpO [Actinopolymorpha cephalotaxi]
MRVSRTAMEQLSALTNCEAAGVSRLESDGDGWVFQVEIIEVPRVPDTTSILASYEARTDSDGNITAYRRQRRYPRNQAGEM